MTILTSCAPAGPATGQGLSLLAYHPSVDHYRDGGMGGIGADHSVVGAVLTEVLVKYRHHDGYWNQRPMPHDVEVIDELRAILRAGRGFHTPLMLEYDHRSRWAYLGEGNHRLAAAVAENVPVLPVRVVRSPVRPASQRERGFGWHASHHPIPGAGEGYIPTDIHPDYLLLG